MKLSRLVSLYKYLNIKVNVPVDSSESSSSHISDLIIREVKSSHKPHASKTIGIQTGNSIMVHMQHSQ